MVVTPPARALTSVSLLNAKRLARSEQRAERFPAGKCPHCRLHFINPVSLQCGHSLCAVCCDELLDRDRRYLDQCTSTNKPQTPQRNQMKGDSCVTPKNSVKRIQCRTPLMGTSTFKMLGDNLSSEEMIEQLPMLTSKSLRTPSCSVCGAAASTRPPIRNHALAQIIKSLQQQKRRRSNVPLIQMDALPEEPQTSTSTDYRMEVSIKKCNVFVCGSQGVGKTYLARTQYLNNLFFGRGEDEQFIKPVTDFDQHRARYMLNIMDEDTRGAAMRQNLAKTHGFVLMYDPCDLESLRFVKEMSEQILTVRRDNPALIIASTKSDLLIDPLISANTGRDLAKSLNAPFYQVSAKDNVGVNELFTHLIQIIDSAQQAKKDKDTVVDSGIEM